MLCQIRNLCQMDWQRSQDSSYCRMWWQPIQGPLLWNTPTTDIDKLRRLPRKFMSDQKFVSNQKTCVTSKNFCGDGWSNRSNTIHWSPNDKVSHHNTLYPEPTVQPHTQFFDLTQIFVLTQTFGLTQIFSLTQIFASAKNLKKSEMEGVWVMLIHIWIIMWTETDSCLLVIKRIVLGWHEILVWHKFFVRCLRLPIAVVVVSQSKDMSRSSL